MSGGSWAAQDGPAGGAGSSASGLRGAGAGRTSSARSGTNLLVRSAGDSGFGFAVVGGVIFSAVVGWSTRGSTGALKTAVG